MLRVVIQAHIGGFYPSSGHISKWVDSYLRNNEGFYQLQPLWPTLRNIEVVVYMAGYTSNKQLQPPGIDFDLVYEHARNLVTFSPPP